MTGWNRRQFVYGGSGLVGSLLLGCNGRQAPAIESDATVFLNGTVLGQELIRKAGALEDAHYREEFQYACSQLRGLRATDGAAAANRGRAP